jgi:hypothetical protein
MTAQVAYEVDYQNTHGGLGGPIVTAQPVSKM